MTSTQSQQQLIPLQKKITTLAQQATSLTITNKEEMEQATIILSNINKYVDSVKEQKETLTKPINLSLKNIRTMFRPLETSYEQAIIDIRTKMTSYQTNLVLATHRAEQAIANKLKDGTIKKIETAVRKIANIEQPAKEVATDAGLVQFAEVKCFEVTDMSLLPLAYHLADEVAIRKAMKDNIELAGVRYFTEHQPRNYR